MEDPWATVNLWRVGPGLVTLMNMACVAFMAHYNGVKYYEELENRSVRKYTITIGYVLLYIWFALSVYLSVCRLCLYDVVRYFEAHGRARAGTTLSVVH